MNDRTDNPGVRVPPPLFYAAAVIGGWLLHRRFGTDYDAYTRRVRRWLLQTHGPIG